MACSSLIMLHVAAPREAANAADRADARAPRAALLQHSLAWDASLHSSQLLHARLCPCWQCPLALPAYESTRASLACLPAHAQASTRVDCRRWPTFCRAVPGASSPIRYRHSLRRAVRVEHGVCRRGRGDVRCLTSLTDRRGRPQ
eukprot:5264115-Prymnesium_polylepis.1